MRKFTDVIVVIAIIAILAAMLLPALQKARDRAKDTQCKNILLNFGKAMGFYAEDNNGHGQYPTIQKAGDSITNHKYSWPVYAVGSLKTFKNYVPDWKTKYRCPGPELEKPLSNPEITYGYNYYIGYSNSRVNRLSCHRQPSRTFVFKDNGPKTSNSGNPWYAEQTVNPKPYTAWRLGLRHSKKANYVFIDGHVGASEKNPGAKTTVWFNSI